jgi:hypothetical protein
MREGRWIAQTTNMRIPWVAEHGERHRTFRSPFFSYWVPCVAYSFFSRFDHSHMRNVTHCGEITLHTLCCYRHTSCVAPFPLRSMKPFSRGRQTTLSMICRCCLVLILFRLVVGNPGAVAGRNVFGTFSSSCTSNSIHIRWCKPRRPIATSPQSTQKKKQERCTKQRTTTTHTQTQEGRAVRMTVNTPARMCRGFARNGRKGESTFFLR